MIQVYKRKTFIATFQPLQQWSSSGCKVDRTIKKIKIQKTQAKTLIMNKIPKTIKSSPKTYRKLN